MVEILQKTIIFLSCITGFYFQINTQYIKSMHSTS